MAKTSKITDLRADPKATKETKAAMREGLQVILQKTDKYIDPASGVNMTVTNSEFYDTIEQAQEEAAKWDD